MYSKRISSPAWIFRRAVNSTTSTPASSPGRGTCQCVVDCVCALYQLRSASSPDRGTCQCVVDCMCALYQLQSQHSHSHAQKQLRAQKSQDTYHVRVSVGVINAVPHSKIRFSCSSCDWNIILLSACMPQPCIGRSLPAPRFAPSRANLFSWKGQHLHHALMSAGEKVSCEQAQVNVARTDSCLLISLTAKIPRPPRRLRSILTKAFSAIRRLLRRRSELSRPDERRRLRLFTIMLLMFVRL